MRTTITVDKFLIAFFVGGLGDTTLPTAVEELRYDSGIRVVHVLDERFVSFDDLVPGRIERMVGQ